MPLHTEAAEAYAPRTEPIRLHVPQGATMADKSPRQHLAKKPGKTIKQKRAEKAAKHAQDEARHVEIVPRGKKR